MRDSDASQLITSKTGYRQFYGLLKDIPLPVSRETGSLLYMLTRSTRAQSILEFGTSFGVSTIYLAAALRDNGGGRIITTGFESSKAARARENLTEAGLIDLIEIREGDALETLAIDLPETFDLVLLDGARACMQTFSIVWRHICGQARLCLPTMRVTAQSRLPHAHRCEPLCFGSAGGRSGNVDATLLNSNRVDRISIRFPDTQSYASSRCIGPLVQAAFRYRSVMVTVLSSVVRY